MKRKRTKLHRYRLKTSHLIDHRQVNRTTHFLESSDKKAIEKYHQILKEDDSIWESVLFAVKGNRSLGESCVYI